MKNLNLLFAVLFVLTTNFINAQSQAIVLSATSEDGSNNLHWSTQQEINSSYFLIERSKDNRNFTSVAQVKSAGHSMNKKNYEFEVSPNETDFYYRITMVTMEGERNTSVAVNTSEKSNDESLAGK